MVAIRDQPGVAALWAPLLAPLGIVAFFLYLWAHTGSPFEYFRAQRAGWQGGDLLRRDPRSPSGTCSRHLFADPDYAVKAVSAVVVVALLVIFFRARPPATWIGYVVAVLALGAISPVIGVTPRLLLRGLPAARGGRGQAAAAVVRGGARSVGAVHGHAGDDGHGRAPLDSVTSAPGTGPPLPGDAALRPGGRDPARPPVHAVGGGAWSVLAAVASLAGCVGVVWHGTWHRTQLDFAVYVMGAHHLVDGRLYTAALPVHALPALHLPADRRPGLRPAGPAAPPGGPAGLGGGQRGQPLRRHRPVAPGGAYPASTGRGCSCGRAGPPRPVAACSIRCG